MRGEPGHGRQRGPRGVLHDHLRPRPADAGARPAPPACARRASVAYGGSTNTRSNGASCARELRQHAEDVAGHARARRARDAPSAARFARSARSAAWSRSTNTDARRAPRQRLDARPRPCPRRGPARARRRWPAPARRTGSRAPGRPWAASRRPRGARSRRPRSWPPMMRIARLPDRRQLETLAPAGDQRLAERAVLRERGAPDRGRPAAWRPAAPPRAGGRGSGGWPSRNSGSPDWRVPKNSPGPPDARGRPRRGGTRPASRPSRRCRCRASSDMGSFARRMQ